MESQNEIRLFPAVSLRFIQLGHGVETFHHAAAPDWLEVTYCREGSLVWQMADGTQVFCIRETFLSMAWIYARILA